MKIVPLEQGTEQWLDWRKKKITATDSVILRGFTDYKTPWRLWSEKKEQIIPVDLSNNPFVKRGRDTEPLVRTFIEKNYPDVGVLIPVCVESEDWSFLGASLDGLDDDNISWEIKVPSLPVYEEVKKNGVNSATYRMYAAQVQHQALTLGNEFGHLVFYDVTSGDHLKFEVFLTEEDKEDIIKVSRRFHFALEHNMEPERDPARDFMQLADNEAKIKWLRMAADYRKLLEQEKELKKIKKEMSELKDNLVALMGDYMIADYGGIRIARYAVKNMPQFHAQLIDFLQKKGIITPELLDEFESSMQTVPTLSEAARVSISNTGEAGKRAVQDEFEKIVSLSADFF